MADMAKLDEAIERLEGMFGGYVGEGDLVDEVNWVIDQLSNERTNTLNKINEVTQTFNDLRDKMKGAAALDPKGNIVLEQFDSTALVVRIVGLAAQKHQRVTAVDNRLRVLIVARLQLRDRL